MEPSGSQWAGTSASPVYHGGNLAQIRARFPEAPEPWIDLSTGINPIAYPVPEIAAEMWTRLPEESLVAALEHDAAVAFGVHDASCVAATPGTQALIQMLPRLIGGASVGILGFTYQEHARVWREAGRTVEVVERLEALARFDVALVVNPNNPDGRSVAAADLAGLALDMAASGRRLIVDEAFVEVMGEGASLAPRLPIGRVVVLRSFGKTWGLAGLRLGFCLADADFAAATRAAFGPWAVSGPAIAVGGAALADRAWLADTIARLHRDVARLDPMLAAAGCRVLGGTPLYRWVAHPDARGLADHLAAAGIHVRRFPHDATRLRFGLPGGEDGWARLEAALDACRGTRKVPAASPSAG